MAEFSMVSVIHDRRSPWRTIGLDREKKINGSGGKFEDGFGGYEVKLYKIR